MVNRVGTNLSTLEKKSDIQSTPSPMVAVPGAKEAPVILGAGIGMAMPKMECKINLRSGNQDAWRRWTVNRNDVITAHGLDALMDNQLMPTVEVIGERFPSLSSAERQEALVASTKQYLSENTQLYFLMKDSVDDGAQRRQREAQQPSANNCHRVQEHCSLGLVVQRKIGGDRAAGDPG